jgi:hypothetical protein
LATDTGVAGGGRFSALASAGLLCRPKMVTGTAAMAASAAPSVQAVALRSEGRGV